MASLSDNQLKNIQGDIWSRGFPKDYETYYLFSIIDGKLLGPCLKNLATNSPPLISTLEKVHKDRTEISQRRVEAFNEAEARGVSKKLVVLPKLPKTNALIAFTHKGLRAIQQGLGGFHLQLNDISKADPAFCKGMAADAALNDPPVDNWDTLFKSDKIHGLLKIAGRSKAEVYQHLEDIKIVLKYGTAIGDVLGESLPTKTASRVDGSTREGSNRGKEHFGFLDNISQPLMAGMDEIQADATKASYNANMETPHGLLVVTEDTVASTADPRPEWMYDGSFLVLRKLEQDVGAFQKLTGEYSKYHCNSSDHMGAKLMGRWPSGAPIAMSAYETADSTPGTTKPFNNFKFPDEVCPYSSHIRKTNVRTSDPNFKDQKCIKVKMIRNGIPYGSDYMGHENEPPRRGLIFACYQGHIETGFKHMQVDWSNEKEFPESNVGHDPIIGQVKQVNGQNGDLTTHFFADKAKTKAATVTFKQLVTMRGGEYFFVPPISALTGVLSAPTPAS